MAKLIGRNRLSFEFDPDINSINDISDITISTALDGQTLVYDSGNLDWRNAYVNPFVDSDVILEDDVDPTKQLKFELGNITTATTRTLTIPDVDATLLTTSSSLGDLSDVDLTGATTDYILQFDGTTWAATAFSGGGGLFVESTTGTSNIVAEGDTGAATQFTSNNGNFFVAGYLALAVCTTGYWSVVIGNEAVTAMGSLQTSVVLGARALKSGTLACNNSVVIGYNAAGGGCRSDNVIIGNSAFFNGGGDTIYATSNVYIGAEAAYSVACSKDENTVIGSKAFFGNSGSQNTLVGRLTMFAGTTGAGVQNSACGYRGLQNTTTGDYNSVLGSYAGYANNTGYGNVFVGTNAGSTNTTGYNNTIVGRNASVASTNLTNCAAIGYNASVDASNKIRLGDANITVVEAATAYSVASDLRLKENIVDSTLGLDFINALRPVKFNKKEVWSNPKLIEYYDSEVDPETNAQINVIKTEIIEPKLLSVSSESQTGFIAQEVEAALNGAAFGGIVTPENDEQYYQLRYETFVTPLVKAVQELTAKVTELENRIQTLESL